MILLINDRAIRHFNSVELTIKFDSIASSFGFDFEFNPDNEDHRALFKPSTYYECEVVHNGETLVTGTVLSNSAGVEAKPLLQSLTGYSKTGVLSDCPVPVDIYPLESNGLTLSQIADKVLRPFGIQFVVDPVVQSAMNQAIEISTASETQSVGQYLSALAAQRNVVISHDSLGRLVFTRAITNKQPILRITPQNKPATKVSLSVNGQIMHSKITVMRQADANGGNAGQSTINNPYVSAYRPTVISQSSGNNNTTAEAARAALSAELRAINLTVELDRFDIDNKVIKPGEIISVVDPQLQLYRETDFFIEGISYKSDQSSDAATLNCVLPEVYNNETPKNIFV